MSKIKKAVLSLLILGILAPAAAVWKKQSNPSQQLIIFHAGSLAVPFKQIYREFNKHYPKVKIYCESAGSRTCARKITDLHRPCDVIASADYSVIDSLLIGSSSEFADWNIKFASNEMVITFSENSRRTNQIDKDNWYNILLENYVTFGRSDPDADPCGYRAVLTIKLAEKFYNQPHLAEKMLTKDQRYIRPKAVDLLALLEAGSLDYAFIYRSVAEQHQLKYLLLPDEINLSNPAFADFYKTVSARLTGKEPGTFITKTAEPIAYGLTIPKNAPNREVALTFLRFLLTADKGGKILENNGQTFVIPSPTDTFDKLPESLKIFAHPEPIIRREL